MSIPSDFEQKGNEGERIVEADIEGTITKPGLVYFGNRLCPFAHRAWLTLLEKNQKFEYVHIDLGDKKPAWYSRVNPAGTVPALFDSGFPVFESLLVLQYLDTKFPGERLYPNDPAEEYKVRFAINIFEERVKGNLYGVLMAQTPDAVQAKHKALTDGLRVLEAYYAKNGAGPYLLGNRISAAEIAIYPFLYRFSITLPHYRQIDLLSADLPRLNQLLTNLRNSPKFRQSSPEPDYLITAYRRYATPKEVAETAARRGKFYRGLFIGVGSLLGLWSASRF